MKTNVKSLLFFVFVFVTLLFSVYIMVSDLEKDTIINDIEQTDQINQKQQETDVITIASWNIENFGQSKANNPEVIQKIADEINKYDIVVLQEISNINEQVDYNKGMTQPYCSRNKDAVSSDNFKLIQTQLATYLPDYYTIQISPQTKDERYAFIFNREKMLAKSPPIMLPNVSQESELCSLNATDTTMERVPSMMGFHAGNWSFTIMTAHTSPNNNLVELDALQYTYGYVAEFYQWNFGDVILAGDLNADCSYLKADDDIRFRQDKYAWLIPDYEDTTVSKTDCTYDRFITLQGIANKRFIGYGVEKNITEDISDHYLVWTKWNTRDIP